ncbi:MAG: ribonuclease Z, partial [Flavobacteriaceae bacterium]|nr:ribonuclease Z [Flavobacteriaceae bacterium]
DVLISHLHGDHYFGLPGLILTFNLLGREKPLNIFGPKGIKEIITSLMKVGKTWTNYKLNFLELNSSEPQVILNKNNFMVTTIPLCHGIYTNGFLFRKKTTSHKLIVKRAIDSGIDKTQFAGIKLGKDGVNQKGEIIKNIKLVEPLSPDIVYAFCSDTLFNSRITEQIRECDLLYHESTFLKKDQNFAVKTFHSTAEQAAIIAKNSNVKKLILGHFSSRYNDLDLFLNEAKNIFENCELATENKSFIF